MKKPIYTDKELLDLIAQDDKGAFQELFHLYYESLARSLLRYSRDPEQIKDWIQEISIRLWDQRTTLHQAGIKNLKAYIIIVARNYVLRETSKKRQIKLISREELTNVEIADNQLEEKFAHLELVKAYAAALATLPPRTRDAFCLSREHGMTYSKVAEKMGTSVKTVEAQISSAISSLRRQLISFF
ncbi:MAG: sigma-70 family RNA polymerase sigma factor [Bacteroidota bacterium]|nr:sigma-70 family RNA polymerase sigma factor [Bacteroidota bacterium]